MTGTDSLFPIADADADGSDLTNPASLKYLRYLERMGLAESYLGPNGDVCWELTEWGRHLQSQEQLPNEFFDDVLH